MLQYSQNAQTHVHCEPNKNCLSPLCVLLPKGPTALLASPHLLLQVVFDYVQAVPFVNALHLLLLNSQVVLISSEGRTTFPLCCWPSLHTRHGQDHMSCLSVFVSSPASSSSGGQQRWCCTRHSLVPPAGEGAFREGTLTASSKCPKVPGFTSFRLSTSTQITPTGTTPFVDQAFRAASQAQN